MNKLLVIGLTGPTGAGKSELTTILREEQIPVVDTDRLAREVVEPGGACLAGLVAAFSPAILLPDGSLDRKALAARAFASSETAQQLSALTHPYIIARTKVILKELAAAGEPLAVVDAPLLFESGMDALCDHTIAVTAPAARRLARICGRDGITEEQARRRMAAQQSDAFYAEQADEVLPNDGTLADFQGRARALAVRMKRWPHES